MPISIGSNIASLGILRRITQSSKDLQSNSEKLSSGLRINRASDDAAGLAVSEALRVKTSILNRARLNVSDGISVLELANGSTEQISNLLTRMVELAEQGANGTYNSAQRSALDKEYQALDKEIRRIASTTTFNGLNILSGSKSRNQSTSIDTNHIGNDTSTAVSADGRYVTYLDLSGQLKQLDSETNTTKIIASGITGIDNLKGSASGEVIAFITADNLNNLNAAGENQVYTYNRQTSSLSIITNTQSGGNRIYGLAVSGDGGTIAFSSNTYYNSSGGIESVNGGGNFRLHAYNLASSSYKASTYTHANSTYELQISSDGSRLLGLEDVNAFAFNTTGSTISATDLSSYIDPSQFTGAGGVSSARITNEGKIYFISNQNISNTNSAGSREVFEFNVLNNSVRKLTNNILDVSLRHLEVSNDGTSLTFMSAGNLTGENSQGLSQFFKFDLIENKLKQNTNYLSTDAINPVADAFSVTNFTSKDGNTLFYVDGGSNLKKVNVGLGSYDLSLETGSGTNSQISIQISAINSALKGLGSYQLTSQSSSRGTLDLLKLNIERLGTLRGTLGAGQSRLDIASRVVNSLSLETTSARSRITDADIANEAANLVRNQILQSTSTALLAQANLQPQIALQLLKF